MNRIARFVTTLGLLIYGVFATQLLSQTQALNMWSSAGQMTQGRTGGAAVLLDDGRVLITGGTDKSGASQATAEVYDPSTGAFTASAAMNVPRANHAAIVLKTGDVLVTGGLTTGGGYSDSAEIYSVSSQQWTLLPSSIGTGLAYQAMAQLSDGNILIAGGTSTTKVVSSLVLYNLTAKTFTPIGTLLTPRTNAVAAATPDGRVLIAGGTDVNGGVLASTEIFVYNTSAMAGTVSAGPTMSSARVNATATSTYDGVAIIGGNNGQNDLGTAEIFSQWTNTFKVVSGGTPRSQHFAVMLPENGSILAMGGTGGTAVDLLQPWANSKAGAFIAAASSLVNHQNGGFGSPASLGSLLAAGGKGSSAGAAELYWFPTISTDRPDYAPGTPVKMTGAGFQPFETVNLHLHEWVDQTTEDDPDATAVADSSGNFSYSGYAPTPKDLGARYHLTAVGVSSGYQAQTIFLDGIGNLSFSNAPLDQAVNACGELIIMATTTNGTYGTIYLGDTTNTGAFYSNSSCTGTAITSVNGAATNDVWYKNTASGSPELSACTVTGGLYLCELEQALDPGSVELASQSESIYAAATQLQFSQSPGGGLPGALWAQQPIVVVQDSNHNTVTGSSAVITLAIASGTGTLACATNPVTASSGVAVFSGCSISSSSNVCYTLSATTPGLTAATSVQFCDENPGNATQSTVSAAPASVTANGTSASTITVTIKDANGNVVPGKTVTLTAPPSGSSNISAGSNGGVTNSAGVVTFTVTDTVAEAVTYTATDTTDGVTVTGTATVTFTVGAVSAGNSTIVANPTNNVTANGTATSTITVQLFDANSNPESGKVVTLTQGTGHSIITTVSGTTNSSGVATFTVTDTSAERVTYTAKDSTDNVTLSSTASVTFTGIATTLTLAAPNPNVVTSGATSLVTFTATLTSGGTALAGATVTFQVDGASVTCQAGSSTTTNSSGQATCLYNPSTLSARNHTVTASTTQFLVAGTGTYAAATSGNQTLTVDAAPTITWTTNEPPASAAYNSTFTIAAVTNPTGGTITYSVAGGCTLAGTTVTMTSGTTACVVTATSAPYSSRGTNYGTFSSSKTVNATPIGQAALTVTGVTVPVVLNQVLTVGTSGGSGTGAVTFSVTGICSVAGNTVTINAGTGSCVVTATKASDADYNSATASATTYGAGATITINSSTLTQTFGAVVPVTATTVPAGLSYAVTYNGSSTEPTAAGSYTVMASVTATGYTGSATGTLVINTAAPGLTLALQSGVTSPGPYGFNWPFNLTVGSSGTGTCPSGGTLTFYVDGSAVETTGPLNGCGVQTYSTDTLEPGSHTVYAVYSGDTNYGGGNSNTVSVTVQIDTTTVMLAATATTINVGQSDTFTATVSPSYTAGSGADVPVGTVEFFDSGTLIDTETLSPTSPYTAVFTTSSLAAGTHSITATFVPTDSNEYSGNSSAIVVTTVDLIAPTITWAAPADIVYGTPLTETPTAGAQLNATTTVPGTFVYTPPAGTVLPVGPANLEVTFTPNDPTTYSQQTAMVTLNVDPATLTVTANPQTMVYGSTVPPLTYAITGFQNSDPSTVVTGTASCTTPASSTSTVAGSPYLITCSVGSLTAANYTFTFVTGNLMVTPATPLLSVACTEVPYDGNAHTCTGTATGVGGATVAGSFSFTPGPETAAGSYGETGTFTSTDGDYVSGGMASGTLIIDPAAVTLTAGSYHGVYDGNTHAPTPACAVSPTYPGGLTCTNVPSPVGPGIGSGGVTPTVSGGTTSNFTTTEVDGSWSIGPATLTVTANKLTMAYGSTVPALTYTITGFVGSDGIGVVSGAPSCTTTATSASTVAGSPYSITCTLGSLTAANYTFTFAPGTLIVTAAPPTLSLSCPGGTYNGTAYSCTGTATGVAGAAPPTGGTWAYNPGSETNAGSYAETGIFTSTDTNYQSGTALGTLTISPAIVQATAGSDTWIYNGSTETIPPCVVTGAYTTGLSCTNAPSSTVGPAVSSGTVTPSLSVSGSALLSDFAVTPFNGAWSITVAPATITLDAGNLTQYYTGSPAQPVTATTLPAGLAYAVTYNGSTTPPTAAGNYTVMASITNSNYVGSTTGTLQIEAAPTTLTLTLQGGISNPALYGTNAIFDLSVPSSSGCPAGGTVQWYVDGGAVGGLVTLTSTSCSAPLIYQTNTLDVSTTAHQIYAYFTSPNSNYTSGPSNIVDFTVSADTTSVTLTVSPTTLDVGQPVTFSAIVSLAVAPGTGDLVPTGTVNFMNGATQLNPGGTTITEISPGTYLATYTDTTLAAGTYNISATYVPGDSTEYSGNSSTVHVVVVDKNVPIITWTNPANIVYGTALTEIPTAGAQLNATAADSSGDVVPGTFAYTPVAGTVLNAGTAQPLSVTFTPTNTAAYATAGATVAITVTAATPTLSLTCAAATYNGAAHTCVGSETGVSGGATPTGTWVYNPASETDAGTYTITGTFTSASGNYVSGGTATGTLTISAAVVTVTAGSYSAAYDGNSHAPSTCTIVGGYTTGLSCANAPASVGPAVGSGTVTPSLSVTGSALLTDFAVTPHNGSWSITQATSTVTVTCNPASVVYNGAAQTPCTATVAGAGTVTGTPTLTYTNNTNVGTATASATYGGDANHTGSTGSKTFTITAAPVTATAGSYSGVYNGATGTPTPACAVTGTYKGSLTCTNTPATVGPGAGTGSITPTVNGSTTNFAVTAVDGTWSITQATSAVTVTCSPTSVGYNGAAQTPCTATVTGAGGLTGSPTVTYTNNTNVGTATASATYAGDANHTGSTNSKTFTITPAAVTATAGSFSGVYNGATRTPAACAVTGAYTVGVTCTDSPATVGAGIGSGSVTPTVSGATANFAVTTVNGSWSITAATPTLRLTCTAATYNGAAHSCTGAATGVGGATVAGTFAFNPASETNVGTYTVTGTFTSTNGNYVSGGTATGTLTITAAAVTATAGSYSGVYNGATATPSACAVTGTYTTGVTCTDSPATVGPAAGSGAVTPTVSGATANFAVTSVNGSWSITAATPALSLTCTAATYNGAAHSCTGTATGVGGATVAGTWVYSPASETNVGTYTVTGTFTSTNGNYASGGTATGTLTIAAAPVTATAGNYSGVYDGNSHAPSACAVTGAYTTGLTCTDTPATVGPNVGSGSVTPTVSGSTTNFAVTSVNGSWSITAATPALSLTCTAATYNGAAHSCTGTATGVGGATVAGTWVYSPASETNVGTYTVTGTFTSTNGNYVSGGTATGTLTITAAPVTATAGSYSGVYNGATATPSACAVTGTYTTGVTCVDNPATVGPGIGSGAVTPTVSGATANFVVTSVNGSWSITAATPALSLTCTAATYNGAAHSCTGTATGVGGATVAGTFAFNPASETNLGTYTVTGTFTSTNGNYASGGTATGTLTITAAPVTATAGSYSGAYDGSSHAPAACAVTGTYTTGVTCTDNPASVGPGVGTGTVTPTVSGATANFAVTSVNGSWSITAATPALSLTCTAATYNGAAHSCTGTATGVGGVTVAGTFAFNPASETNVGTYTVTGTFTSTDSDYASGGTATGTLTINPAAVTATAGNYSGAYDGSAHAPSACAVTGAYTVGLSCANTPASVGAGVGSGAVTPTVSGGTGNFTITAVNGAWSITQATSTVTVTCPVSVVYNGAAQTPCTATYSGVGLTTTSLTVTYTSNTNAGTASASASYAGDANHSASSNTATFTINPAAVTATAGSYSAVYDGSAHAPSACAVTGADTGSLSCTNTPASVGAGVGTGAVTPTVSGGTSNFTITAVNGAWSITTAPSTVTVTCPVSVAYNGAAQAPCTATYSGVGLTTTSLTVTYTSNTNAGTATASASFAGDANHAASSNSASFTISAAAVTATAGNYSAAYDGSAHAPSACAVTGPYTVGLSCTNTPASVGAGVGTGTVTPTVSGGTSNFAITAVNGAWSITTAPSSVTVTCPASAVYNGAAQTPCTAAVTGVGGLNQTLTVSYASNINAGTATASASFAGDANHAAGSNSASFTIDAATVTATAGNYSGVYDGSSHAPSACALTGAYTVGLSCANTPAPVGPGVGTGAVTPTVSGGTPADFTITTVNGAWSITKATSTVTVTCPASVAYSGAAQTPCTATVTGAGGMSQSMTVSYTNNINAGTATATASFAGDGNHAAGSNSASFTIAQAVATVTLSNLAQYYTGSPLPVTVTTAPTGLSVTVLYSSASYPSSATAPTNPGSYTVTATVVNANYAGLATQTLVIYPASSGLTLQLHSGTPEPSPYGMMVYFDLGLGGTPCPTGTVQFYVDGTATGSPVTLNGSSCSSPVTFQTATLTPGSHSVYAAYSGDTLHSAGNSNTVTHAVMADTTAVTLATSATNVNAGQPVTFTATVTPTSLDPSAQGPAGTVQFFDGGTSLGTITLSSTSPYTAVLTTSSLAAGPHSISATYSSSDGEFTGSSSAVAVTVTVDKISPTINWSNPANIVYGTALSGTQLNATATDATKGNSPVAGTFAYTPVSGTVLPVGTVNLEVSFTPSDAATYSTQTATVTLTVTAVTLTVTADDLSRAYGANNPTLTYQISGFVNGDTLAAVNGAAACSTTATTASPVSGSPYAITCTQGTLSAADYGFKFVSGTLTVTAVTPTLALTCTEMTYDGNPHACVGAATGVSGAAVGGSWSYTPASETAAGSYPVTGTFTSTNGNYQGGTATGTLKIDAAAVTATAGSYSGVDDGSSHAPSACAVTGAYTGGLTCTDGPASVGPGVGTGTVTPSVSGGTSNFAITAVNGAWSITTAPSSVTVTCPASAVYNGAAQTPCTAAVTGVGGLNQTLTVSYASNINAGTATASASFAGDANHAAGSNSASFTIDAATVTATAGNYSGVYDGSSHAPSACALTGAYTVGLSCANTPAPVGPGVGTGAVTPTVSGGTPADFTITTVNGAWSITKATSTVTVTCPASVAYSGAAQTPCTATVTGAGGMSQSMTVSYTNNINAGTATATASFAGDGNHAAGSNSASFTIAQAVATVTLSNLAQYYTGSPLPVTVTTAPTGLSVTVLYSSASYPSSATAPTNPGSYTVTATVVNANYAGLATQTLVIYPASSGLTLQLRSGMPEPSPYGTMVYFDLGLGGTPCPTGTVQFYVDGTATGSAVTLNGSSCSTPVTFQTATLGVGMHSVYAAYSGDTLHSPGNSNTVTHGVTANTTAVALATSASSVNAGQPVTLTATVTPTSLDPSAQGPAGTVQFFDGGTSLGTITLSSTSPYTAVLTTSSLAAGPHSISATYSSSDGEFTGSSSAVAVTVTVDKISPTINWSSPANIVYGTALSGTQLNATATDATNGNSPVAGTFAYTPVAGTVLPVGTVNLEVSFTPSDTATYSTQTATVTLTVTAVTPTLAVTCTEVTYDGNAHACTGTATGLDGVTAVAGSWSYTPASETAAGSYTVTGTFTSTDSNYQGGTATGTLKIDAAAVTATAGSYSGVADGSSHAPSACAVTGAFTGGLTCTDSPASVGPAVGTGTVTPVVNGGSSNFAITSVNGNWSITQPSATPTVTTVSCPASAVYNGAAQTPCTATVTGAGGLNQTLTVSYASNINAGTATASASYAGNTTYGPSSNSANFTINPAAVTATAGSYSAVQDGSSHAPSACAVTGAFTGGLTCTDSPASVGPAVGTGTVTPVVNGGSSNFAITSVNGNWSITQPSATPTVTTVSCPASAVYNGAAQTPCTATVTGAGGLNQTLTVSYASNINAGTATASASYAGNTTYGPSSNSANFTINPAAVTATAGSYSAVQDGSSHAPSACAVTGAFTGGLTCTDNPVSVGPAVGTGTVTPVVNGGSSNFAITSVNGNWSITQPSATPTVTTVSCPASAVYNGAAQAPCTATVTGAGGLSQTLTVSYASNINAGTATASASYAGNTTYGPSSNSANFTINPAAVTATAGSYSAVQDGSSHAPSACAVTGAFTGGLSCTNNPASVGPAVGTGTVTPVVSGGTSNFAITSVNGNWSITQASATPTVTTVSCPASALYNGAAQVPCTATVTGAGGLSQTLTVSYASNINAGTATASASYAGNTTYGPSSNSANFTINPAAVTATAGSYSAVQDGSSHAPSACAVTGAFTGGLSCTNNPASVGPAVGTGTVTPVVSGGTSNFAITSVNGNWSITQASATPTVTTVSCPASAVYNGAAQVPCTATVTGAGGLSQTLTVSYASNINAGTATASASYAGNTTYGPSSNSANFTINPAAVTATAGSYSAVQDGSSHAPSACAVTGAYTVGLSCTNNPASVGPAVGTGTVTPVVNGGTSNFAITSVNGNWSITQGSLTVTTTTVSCPASALYNGAAQAPCTATVTGAGGLNQTLTVSYTNNTNAGTATAHASYAGNTTYGPSSNSANFTINPAAVTATAGSYSAVQDGSSHAPSACAVTGAFTGGLSCTNNPASVGPAVGTGTVTPVVNGGTSNFAITAVNGAWSITQGSLTATTTTVSCPASALYNGAAQVPCTATVTGAGGLSQTLTVTYASNINAGTATASASYAGNTTYGPSSNSANFTINPAAVTATAGGYSGAYDGSSHAPSACAVTGAYTVGLSCTNAPVSVGPAVGSGTVTPVMNGGTSNFTITAVNGAWSIAQASSSVAVTCPASVAYSGAAQTPCTATVTGAGGMSQPMTVSYTNNTNAGTATATASFAGNTTYGPSSNSASFTINAASQAITFAQPTSPVIYGASPITLSATGGASGMPVVFSIDASSTGSGTISGSTLAVTGIGNLIIDANQAGNSNYLAATPVTRTIVVSLAALTVAANNASRVYGTNNPAFTGSVTGAVRGDTYTESYSTVATITSNVGSYPVVPSVTGADLSDYAVTVQDGVLTITQAGTTTSINASGSSVTPGQSVTLTAQVAPATTGTPTGSVAFYDGTSLLGTVPLTAGTATLSTSSLTAGSSNTLEAVYSGDNNFTTSTSSTSTVGVAALDFTLAVSGAASQTVNGGNTATYQVVVNPLYGSYPGTVSFAASGTPTGASIAFSPSTIAANAGKQTVTVTVQTPALAKLESPAIGRKLAPLALALFLIPLLGAGRLRRQGRRLSKLASLLLLLVCTLAGVMMTVTGCGGAAFKAALQNYTITVTSTSGNVQHTASVSLTVE